MDDSSEGPVARSYDEKTTTESGISSRNASEAEDLKVGAVELVVVHGMGSQKKSETLYEWAEPLLRRIEWLSTAVTFDGVGQRVQQDDEAVSVWADYRDLEDEPRRLHLTITEARWSESFIALKRSEVFTWGMSFVWKTFLRLAVHFTRVFSLGVLQILARSRFHQAPAGDTDVWRRRLLGVVPLLVVGVPTVILVIAFWAVLLVLAVVITVLLPVLSIILVIPFIKKAIQGAVDTIVDFVGDVATWKRRPVRAAAMRQVVRNTIESAHLRLESHKGDATPSRVIVLAHSQGSAVSAQTLFSDQDGEPPKVDTFISVGAAVTLLGSSRLGEKLGSRIKRAFGMGAYDSLPSPLTNPVDDWSAAERETEWLNFWAIWDPFAAGTISVDASSRRKRWWAAYRRPPAPSPAIGPEEHAVHNTSSPLTDHQSYAANIVQVVDPVARLILGVRPPDDEAHATKREVILRRSRLHSRSLKDLGLNRLLILAVTILALVDRDLVMAAGDFVRGIAEAAMTWFEGIRGGFVATYESVAEGEIVASDASGIRLDWNELTTALVGMVALLGVAVFLIWLNSLLWRTYIRKVTWRPEADLGEIRWISGALGRLILIGTLLVQANFAVTGAGASPVRAGQIMIALGVVGLLVFAAPWLSREPAVVPSRRKAG